MWNDQETPRVLLGTSEVRLARETSSHEGEKESYVVYIFKNQIGNKNKLLSEVF